MPNESDTDRCPSFLEISEQAFNGPARGRCGDDLVESVFYATGDPVAALASRRIECRFDNQDLAGPQLFHLSADEVPVDDLAAFLVGPHDRCKAVGGETGCRVCHTHPDELLVWCGLTQLPVGLQPTSQVPATLAGGSPDTLVDIPLQRAYWDNS